ncbi:MBL fold metallo-hydrolase [Virgibacillus natechei]
MIDIFEKEDVICVEGKIEQKGTPGQAIYTFLVDGMLIDTGPKQLEAELTPFYEEHAIDLVTLTHSHEDHTGTASYFQEKGNVPIYIHPLGITTCRAVCPYPKYRQIAWGVRDPIETRPIGDTIQSRNTEWKVIYTPGHAADHISLLDEETGRLFSGDLFVNPKPKVIMDSESIPVTMNSIRKLLSYDFGSMFCCHAGYIQDGKAMLEKKLDNLENLSGEVKQLYKEGLSVDEITQRFFPKKYSIIKASGGEWDSKHIVSSILSEEGA